MKKVNIAAKAHVASRGIPPDSWGWTTGLFIAGAVWAQKEFALQLLKDLRKRRIENARIQADKGQAMEPSPGVSSER